MKILEKKLANGVRIVMIPQPDAPTATALLLVGTGSKYETNKERGLSHFVEHMLFKGTEKYPTARSISEALDNLGAISNAFTSYEFTGYYAKGSPQHIPTFLDVLSDIYLHSTFPEKEIEKEKGVIVEEINMQEDDPQRKIWDVLLALVYGDQPVGQTVIGTKESVTSFSRKDFLHYVKNHYIANNTMIVVSGAFDPKSVYKVVAARFAGASAGRARGPKKVVDKQTAPQITVFKKNTDQAHIALAFRSVPLNHADGPTASLLATILGGGMSSRLFLELREELGAAYYTRAEQDGFVDHGLFTISAGIDKNRLQEITQRIIALLKDLKDNPVSKEELQKVKEYSLGMLRLGLESSDNIAEYYGMQLLLKGTYRNPEQLTKEYLKVTASDIQRLAKKIFVANHANLAVIGPFEGNTISPHFLKRL